VAEKSKAPLNLMEQVVMILVFAFAAALCVQAFVVADSMSKEVYARDKAAVVSQMVAETVKSQKGDRQNTASILQGFETETGVLLLFDRDWEQCSETEALYTVELAIKEADAYISRAEIVTKEVNSEKIIFSLPVSWQE